MQISFGTDRIKWTVLFFNGSKRNMSEDTAKRNRENELEIRGRADGGEELGETE
jgi:hypothetical protein